jgi:hypothetical protein
MRMRKMSELKILPGVVVEAIPSAPKKKRSIPSGETPEGIVKAEMKAFFDHIGAFKFMPSQNGRGDRGVDFIVIWRSAGVAIEAKAPGEKATDKQRDFLNEWAKRGGWAFEADSIESLVHQWSEECLSCGTKPPAICSMTGTALREALGFRAKRKYKTGSSISPTTSVSKPRSPISKRSIAKR